MDMFDANEWEDIKEWVNETLTSKDTVPDGAVVKSPSVSGSDPDGSGARRRIIGTCKGKIAKRRSRASPKARTTFIAADPENFKNMVQEVTGLKVGNGQVAVAPVLKPEPQRLVDRVPGSWPTLDSSAYMVGGAQQHGVGPAYSVPVDGGNGGGGGFCFQSFDFPS
ncbi:hypothetical protein AgCh_036578 [Apium graveolens]